MSLCLDNLSNLPLPTKGQVRVNHTMSEADVVGNNILWLPEYWRTYWRVIWQIADDIYDGLHDYQIRSLYLIQKPGEPNEAYTARLLATSLDNHFRDCVDFYSGLLSLFDINEETPEALSNLFDNADGAGNSLQKLLIEADKEALKKEACLVLVDPPTNGVGSPRLRMIPLSDIYSPIVEHVGDRYVITQLCVHRKTQRRKGDYGVEPVDQYWMYTPGEVIVFEKIPLDNRSYDIQEIDRMPLLKASGEPLMEVPVVWYSCGGEVPMMPETPPFHRLLEISQKQMNKISELDDAEGKVNTITPLRFWPDDAPTPLPPMRLGANSVWDIEQARDGAKAEMLEAKGNAIALTHQRNQDRVEQMKELSRAFIGGRSTLTATEASQNDARSKVNLRLVAAQKESTVQEIFRLMMQFIDPNFKPEKFEGGIKISDEALRPAVDSQDIKIIQDGYLTGAYSRRYMLQKLREVGFQPEGIDIDEELNTVPEVE